VTPFSLKTYDQAYKMKEAISVAVSQGTMPPWSAASGCNDYTKNGSLTAEEKETLLEWVRQGAVEGDSIKEGPSVENPARQAELSRVDLSFSMDQSYVPKKYPDDYRCFVMDWVAGANEGYVTGFRANPGNLAVAHHVIAYLIPPGEVENIEALDAADSEYGYECFGGPGTSGRFEWLGAWAPGSRGDDFPEGTGIELTEGSKIVLQLHYNSFDTSPGPDQTSVDLKIDPEVERRATILLWLNFRWLDGDTMHIPAGEKSVEHFHLRDPTIYMDRLTDDIFAANTPFRIYWSALHMHELGKKTRMWIDSQGEETCLLDIPQWDFNWQFTYETQETVVFRPGDQLGISCEWDNSASNQHRVDGQLIDSQDVQWGDGTQDEMCLGILYITAAD
jgi:hypothetical protein